MLDIQRNLASQADLEGSGTEGGKETKQGEKTGRTVE